MTTATYDRWVALAERDTLGEELTAEERRFLGEYAATDPAAFAELAVFDSLASLDTSFDDASNEDFASKAVALALSPRVVQAPVPLLGEVRRTKARWLFWGVGSAAAAAAAFAIVVRSTPGPAPRLATSVVEYVAASVSVGGQVAEKGTRVALGSEVTAVGGPVCVAVEPRIHACLESGAKARLSAVGKGKRRIDLLEGRVAMALDPLPPGERLSVVANGVWSTAVGTAFTVELGADGSVRTIVHEGKVAVGTEGATDIVDSHKIGLSTAGELKVLPPAPHASLETPDWVALAQVANRSIEGPVAEVMPSVTESSAPEAPPPVHNVPRAARVAVAPHVASPATEPVEAPAPAVTPASLLAAARQALREQRWADASQNYRQLVSSFPGTPEAHTVLVSLAKVEIDRLGQPAAALRDLDAYLATGGPLALEAKLAKVKAYRALGRSSDEAAAIDDVLAAQPGGLEVEALRRRLDELRH